jgi:S-adenosylmethionine hydrolase
MRPVYFLSDFGLEDPYAGIVQAVLEARAPGVRVVHLAHGLPPGDLRRAAYALFEALPYLPPGTVLLAVVDPGVGTGRRAVAAWGERLYVGPDNGLFTLAWLLDPPQRAFLPENPLPHPGPRG